MVNKPSQVQKTVGWIGAGVLALACIVVPWKDTSRSGSVKLERSIGYAPIFAPPESYVVGPRPKPRSTGATTGAGLRPTVPAEPEYTKPETRYYEAVSVDGTRFLITVGLIGVVTFAAASFAEHVAKKIEHEDKQSEASPKA
jgi:hypothetical protein